MAASTWPKPGSKYGPCVDSCQHRDRAETRRMAARNCVGCAGQIDYERAFYRQDGDDLIHAVCAEAPRVTTHIIFGTTTPERQGPKVTEVPLGEVAPEGNWKLLSPSESERLKKALQRRSAGESERLQPDQEDDGDDIR